MENLHAPTVISGPTSAPTANGNAGHLSFAELQRKKDDVEAELKALGSVLDSVRRIQRFPICGTCRLSQETAWRWHGYSSVNERWLPSSRHRRCSEYEHEVHVLKMD